MLSTLWRPLNRVDRLGSIACLALTVVACGDDSTVEDEPPPRPALSSLPTLSEAPGIDVAALRGLLEEVPPEAPAGEAAEEVRERLLHAGRLGLLLAAREPGATALARSHLEAAAAALGEGSPVACRAQLELARLEASFAGRPAQAYVLAHTTLHRSPDHGCQEQARWMLDVLDAYRPSDDVLGLVERAAIGTSDDRREPPTLRSVAVYGEDTQVTRVVLGFDRRVAASAQPADGSLTLHLAEARLGPGVQEAFETSHGTVRFTRNEEGVRARFTLPPSSEATAFFLEEPFRVVVDLGARSRARQEVQTVVLDPGHGGNEFGAHHRGLKESELTLDIAQRVATELETSTLDCRVMLTRRNDQVVSLEERVAFANAVDADVFVSIHLNGWEDELDRGGVTTFVLDTANDRQARRLAARENGTSAAQVSALEHLLASLHREQQVAASRTLAEAVHEGTLLGGREVLPQLPDRGVRSAMFYVLVGARMPAILLEASFLSQPDENRALATSEYRAALARGIARGIVRYATLL